MHSLVGEASQPPSEHAEIMWSYCVFLRNVEERLKILLGCSLEIAAGLKVQIDIEIIWRHQSAYYLSVAALITMRCLGQSCDSCW